MKTYDITFVGHMCWDEIVPHEGETRVAAGSAVLCGAMAAVRAGAKVAVLTRLAAADRAMLAPMESAGVDVTVTPVPETTWMRVIHPTADLDVRRMYQVHSAGPFRLGDVPALSTRFVHLAGVTDQEFTLDLLRGLQGRGYSLSADMQSFVRQVHPSTREIAFADVPAKRAIAGLLDRIKLDVVEAKILTGHDDLEAAAAAVAEWGCREIMITRADGVLVRVGDDTWFERFSNRNSSGRTGRGDTTFAAYMAWRLSHPPAEAVKFAAALVSMKMETPGPFAGTLEDVLRRMREQHA